MFIALALSALLVLWSRRRPTYGAATPGLVLAWRNRSERRRVEKQRSPGRSAGFNNWWHTSGPVVSYREWKSSRHAGRTVQRQIEERRRLRGQDD
ncbi:MAG: hypothetical protein U9R47_10480 [Actinomycetota bacterium]|nr:hypothetical protein [Actinomycetota bacterium]